jgi:hypothetical protein
MNLENKMKNISYSNLVAILVLITIILVYLQVPNVLWAKECPQKRSTVIAPNKYFNKVNPLRNEAPHLKK